MKRLITSLLVSSLLFVMSAAIAGESDDYIFLDNGSTPGKRSGDVAVPDKKYSVGIRPVAGKGKILPGTVITCKVTPKKPAEPSALGSSAQNPLPTYYYWTDTLAGHVTCSGGCSVSSKGGRVPIPNTTKFTVKSGHTIEDKKDHRDAGNINSPEPVGTYYISCSIP